MTAHPQHVSEIIQTGLADRVDGAAAGAPPATTAAPSAVLDLMSLGVLPGRAAELVASIERSRNGFFSWSLLLTHTELDALAAMQFLKRHGFFPKWSAEVAEMRR